MPNVGGITFCDMLNLRKNKHPSIKRRPPLPIVAEKTQARKLRSGSKVAPTEGRQSMILHRATSARNFDQMSQLSRGEDDDEDDDSSSTDLGADSARTKASCTASGGGTGNVGLSAVGDADELTFETTGSGSGSESVQDANPPNVLAGGAASGSIHPRQASAAGQIPAERPRSPPSLSLLPLRPHEVSGDASTDNGGSRGGDSRVGDNVPVSRERRRVTGESAGSDPESGFRNTPGPLDEATAGRGRVEALLGGEGVAGAGGGTGAGAGAVGGVRPRRSRRSSLMAVAQAVRRTSMKLLIPSRHTGQRQSGGLRPMKEVSKVSEDQAHEQPLRCWAQRSDSEDWSALVNAL